MVKVGFEKSSLHRAIRITVSWKRLRFYRMRRKMKQQLRTGETD